MPPTPPESHPRPSLRPASAGHARKLLRALRDVNSTDRLRVSVDQNVFLEGCQSLDQPVEQGVHYRVRWIDGSAKLLTIEARGHDLVMQLYDREPGTCGPAQLATTDRLMWDPSGHTIAPGLRARWPEQPAGRQPAERFLRRVVRGMFAA